MVNGLKKLVSLTPQYGKFDSTERKSIHINLNYTTLDISQFKFGFSLIQSCDDLPQDV